MGVGPWEDEAGAPGFGKPVGQLEPQAPYHKISVRRLYENIEGNIDQCVEAVALSGGCKDIYIYVTRWSRRSQGCRQNAPRWEVSKVNLNLIMTRQSVVPMFLMTIFWNEVI